ncbi:hypothetical protein R1sor_008557 [Riccia sorocarpa]|uniref:Uncharacterized protein n=1 Tax=Riccia sorocarpa TaxID=122646 RepID=A0ABD3HVG0_9MARC
MVSVRSLIGRKIQPPPLDLDEMTGVDHVRLTGIGGDAVVLVFRDETVEMIEFLGINSFDCLWSLVQSDLLWIQYRGTLTSIVRQLCQIHHPDLHLTVSHLTPEESYPLFTNIRARFTRDEELSHKELTDTIHQHFKNRKYGKLRKLKALITQLDYNTHHDALLEKSAWISETSFAVMLPDAQQCFWHSEPKRTEAALETAREDETAGRELLRPMSYFETR